MGLLATGTSCLALVWVIGRSRVPAPPARISAFTGPVLTPVTAGRRAPGRRGRSGRRWITSPAVTSTAVAARGAHVQVTPVVDLLGPADDGVVHQLDADVPADGGRRGPGVVGDGQQSVGAVQLAAPILQMGRGGPPASRPGPPPARPAASADTAPRGSSSAAQLRFMPRPTTIASPSTSARIPASLRSSTTRSFGHLTSGRKPATASHADAAASATAAVTRWRRSAASPVGRSRTDASSEASGGAVQVRPRRPRPAVW